ncbi:MAG: hypothetical protein ABJG88_00780 [Litorimonas sp.]
MAELENQIETDVTQQHGADHTKVNPFDAVRDKIKFEGFTDSQKEAILDQYEEAYNAPGGTAARDMIDAGIALPDGLTVHNSNSQSVMSDYADNTVAKIVAKYQTDNPGVTVPQAQIDASELQLFDAQLGEDFSPSTERGQVYISAYPSIADEATNTPEVYTYPGSTHLGQTADASDPLRSIDKNGVMFDVPPIHTLLHETNHAVTGDIDLAPDRPTLIGNVSAGQLYTTNTTGNAADDYRGPNETATQEMLKQNGYTQLRGAYIGNWAPEHAAGTDFSLGREHEVGLTSNGPLDMTTHDPVAAVVVDAAGSWSTLRLGDKSDTVHAFDGNDTVYTGGGADRVFLGSGDDVAHAGWGNNTIDGGDANLDPASDHKSDVVTDWGFDTVDYTTLPTGFAAPEALSVDTSFDGAARDGILITMDGADVSVTKGTQYSFVVGEDVDRHHNIDAIKGTNRDDLTEVSEFSGDRALDGAGGTDTLLINTLPDGNTATNVAGPVTFNGASYDGYVTDGTDKLYYKGIENIVVERPEAAGAVGDPVDANGAAPIIPPVDGALNGAPTGHPSLDLEDAVRILHEEGAEAVELERASGIESGPISTLINTPAGVSVMETLVAHGDRSLELDPAELEGDAYSRVTSVLRSSMERVEEIDKVDEFEARKAQHLEQVAEVDAAVQPTQVVEAELEYEYGL